MPNRPRFRFPRGVRRFQTHFNLRTLWECWRLHYSARDFTIRLEKTGPRDVVGLHTLAIYPQLAAFLTSALIFASSAAVNSFSAKATGHMEPSSRFALSLNPSVEYLALNF